MEAEKKTSASKRVEAAKKVRPMVKALYSRALDAKKEGKLVAYCMVRSLYDEILVAMDIAPVWTENYAALCAVKRVAEPYLLKAESVGFPRFLCGYARTGLGFDILHHELDDVPPDAPDGGMAIPDMLLGSSAICDPRYKWYQSLGTYLEVPVYSIDVVVPPIDANLKEIRGYYIKYQVEQLRGLVEFLEKHTGKKMDWEKLNELVHIGTETYRKWWECYELRKAIPCPMPSQDHFRVMVPAYFYLGRIEALNFYQELYDELEERVKNKIGVVPDEKYRLLWGGGLPPWHTMNIFDHFAEKGAVFVSETSYYAFEPPEIPSHVTGPLEVIAWRSFGRETYRYEKARKGCGDHGVQLLLDLIGDYKIDGVVTHVSISCRATSIGQIHFRNVLQRETNMPYATFESDIVDVGTYSEIDTKTHIDTFIETVDAYKGSKRVA